MGAGSGGRAAGCWGGLDDLRWVGVSSLFGVNADGGPSGVIKPLLLKPDVDVVSGGRIVIK